MTKQDIPAPYAVISASIIVADQITKYWAVGALTRAFEGAEGFGDKLSRFVSTKHPVAMRTVEVVADFWHFRYAENTGAAFSVLAGKASWLKTGFLLAVSVAAMVFIVSYFRKSSPEQRFLRTALAMVLGGAVGNFIDRVRLGYVIDFIDWHWYDKATWPTFNVADSAITVGVSFLVIDMLREWWAEKKAKSG